jgi:lysophospholipase L1-like esterase
VLNAGVIGFDSQQEMILLASELLDYRPDLVLFFDGWNDFYNGGQSPDERGVEHPHFRDVDAAIARGQQPFRNLLRYSAFYRALERKLPGWRLALGIDAPEERGYGRFRHREDAALRYGRNLERMIRLARAYGAASLVAPQPEIFQRRAPAGYEQYKRAQLEEDGYADYARAHYRDYLAVARRVADAEGVPFLDTSAIFEDLREDVFTDLCHLNDRGQARVAEAFEAPVEQALAARGAPRV